MLPQTLHSFPLLWLAGILTLHATLAQDIPRPLLTIEEGATVAPSEQFIREVIKDRGRSDTYFSSVSFDTLDENVFVREFALPGTRASSRSLSATIPLLRQLNNPDEPPPPRRVRGGKHAKDAVEKPSRPLLRAQIILKVIEHFAMLDMASFHPSPAMAKRSNEVLMERMAVLLRAEFPHRIPEIFRTAQTLLEPGSPPLTPPKWVGLLKDYQAHLEARARKTIRFLPGMTEEEKIDSTRLEIVRASRSIVQGVNHKDLFGDVSSGWVHPGPNIFTRKSDRPVPSTFPNIPWLLRTRQAFSYNVSLYPRSISHSISEQAPPAQIQAIYEGFTLEFLIVEAFRAHAANKYEKVSYTSIYFDWDRAKEFPRVAEPKLTEEDAHLRAAIQLILGSVPKNRVSRKGCKDWVHLSGLRPRRQNRPSMLCHRSKATLKDCLAPRGKTDRERCRPFTHDKAYSTSTRFSEGVSRADLLPAVPLKAAAQAYHGDKSYAIAFSRGYEQIVVPIPTEWTKPERIGEVATTQMEMLIFMQLYNSLHDEFKRLQMVKHYTDACLYVGLAARYDHPTWTFCRTVASQDPLDISRGFIRLLKAFPTSQRNNAERHGKLGEDEFSALHDVSGMMVELMNRAATIPSGPTLVWIDLARDTREINLKDIFLSLLDQIERPPSKKE